MSEYMETLEEESRWEVLNAFEEIIDDAVEMYSEKYAPGEEVGAFRAPYVQSFRGPAAVTTESNNSRYRVSGRGWKINFELTVFDEPYHEDDLVDKEGRTDMKSFSDSVRGTQPEKTRSRYLNLSPEKDMEDFNEDRWHCLNNCLEEVLGSEKRSSSRNSDFTYHFDLRYTRGMTGEENRRGQTYRKSE